ncbi:phosphate signaling complex protein PhoU [Allonocardiopsis opalescens]|uniref:Phosphate-specific transport system accessory protein PhoU n=1 Tax=Allonocardiopsis opalescens TaxID=1144618 RepID=A0A2T0QA84_9ACTN|nr:phosphate signaling complex protein PhoU [Allonocardiopsis opalescens]PRY00730.1 PhoU-like phosphate uptake regulator [Allonocardiopsis opalescens]
MRDTYHEELDAVTDRLVRLTQLVRTAMARATTALLDADLQAAESVITGDAEVNRLNDETEEATLELMALQQPVAKDLRTLVTSMQMASELERMGDLAVHIAKIARRRHPDSAVPQQLRPIILEMGTTAELLITKTGTVIATHDDELAKELEGDDDRMDALRTQLLTRILSSGWQHGVEPAVDLTLAGRYFERYADHAVHVAHNMIYVITGEKHEED